MIDFTETITLIKIHVRNEAIALSRERLSSKSKEHQTSEMIKIDVIDRMTRKTDIENMIEIKIEIES